MTEATHMARTFEGETKSGFHRFWEGETLYKSQRRHYILICVSPLRNSDDLYIYFFFLVKSYFIFPGSKEAEFISIVFISQGTSTSFTSRWVGIWTSSPHPGPLTPHSLSLSLTVSAPPTHPTLFPTQDVCARDSLGPGCTSTHTAALERGASRALFLKQAFLLLPLWQLPVYFLWQTYKKMQVFHILLSLYYS